jgi:hypothetical protein
MEYPEVGRTESPIPRIRHQLRAVDPDRSSGLCQAGKVTDRERLTHPPLLRMAAPVWRSKIGHMQQGTRTLSSIVLPRQWVSCRKLFSGERRYLAPCEYLC